VSDLIQQGQSQSQSDNKTKDLSFTRHFTWF
jgi:hypothetical protein